MMPAPQAGARLAPALAAVLSGGKSALHLWLAPRYGIHRDELYFIDCGRHLDWGYVDHPPFVPFVARAMVELFGVELHALRAPAALASAATVLLTMPLTARFGGGARAQLLAGLAAVVAGAYLRMAKILCIPVSNRCSGAPRSCWLTRRDARPRLWLGVGALARIIHESARPRPSSRLHRAFTILENTGSIPFECRKPCEADILHDHRTPS